MQSISNIYDFWALTLLSISRWLNFREVKISWKYVYPLVLTDRPPPIILQGPANQTLAVDGTALLKCKATGDPLPVISWLKEGFTFLGRDPRATIQEQGTLQIKNLRVSNIGLVFESSPQDKYCPREKLLWT